MPRFRRFIARYLLDPHDKCSIKIVATYLLYPPCTIKLLEGGLCSIDYDTTIRYFLSENVVGKKKIKIKNTTSLIKPVKQRVQLVQLPTRTVQS